MQFPRRIKIPLAMKDQLKILNRTHLEYFDEACLSKGHSGKRFPGGGKNCKISENHLDDL